MKSNLLNLLTNSRAELRISALPNVTYTLTEYPLPGVELPTAKLPSPFVDFPIHGDKPVYDPLLLTFIVTENLENWLEAHSWIRALAYPKEYPEYANRKIDSVDASLVIYSSHNNPVLRVTFIGCVPTRLGDIDFTTRASDTDNVTSTLMLEYARYDIEVLNDA